MLQYIANEGSTSMYFQVEIKVKFNEKNKQTKKKAERKRSTGNVCLCTFLVESVDGQQSPPSYWQ